MAQKGLGQSQATKQSQAGCQPSGNYQSQSRFSMPMNQQAPFSQFKDQPLMGQNTVMPVMPPGMMGGWNGMYFMQPQKPFMDYAGQGEVAAASSLFSQPNPGQLNQTMGSGNGSYSNGYQNVEPRHWNPDNGANNADVQHSRGKQDDSRGRQSFGWGGDKRDGGGKRHRSRSPREQEWFQERRRSSPNRLKYDDQYHRDQPQGHNYNQSSQRQDCGRRETYNLQNRNNLRENDEVIPSTLQPRDSWNHLDANSFRQSQSGRNRPNPNSFGQSESGRNRYNDAQTEGPSQRRSCSDEFQSQRAARPIGPQAECSFRPRADWVPAKKRRAKAAQPSGQSGAAAKPAQQPPKSGPTELQPADADRLTNALKRRDAAFRPQAAAFVVKMMLTEDLLTKLPEKYIGKQKLALRSYYTKAIKKEVNSRLEELLGDSLGNSIEEMTIKYRQKFPPEQNLEFILHILEITPKEEPKVKEPRDGKVKEKAAANEEENPAPLRAYAIPPANTNYAPPTKGNSASPTKGNSASPTKGNSAPPPKGNSAPPPKGNSAPPPKGNSAPPPKGNSAPPPKGNSAPPVMGKATAKKQDAGGSGQTAKQGPPLASRDYIKVVLTAWQKKRLRELLEQGVSHEEALIQCLLGITIAKSVAAQDPNPDIQTEANSTMANTPSETDKVPVVPTPNVDITPGVDTDTVLAISTATNTPGLNTDAQPANPSAENNPWRRETVNSATSSNTHVKGNDWQSAGTSIRHPAPPANTSTRMRKEPPKTIPKRYVHNKGGIRAFSFIDPFLRVGITDLNQPLTREQEVKVLVYLFRLIETDMASGSELPSIRMMSQPGWMLFACENKLSRRWLARAIAGGQPWKGSKLMLMNVNEFPKTHRCKAWIPGPPEDTGDIELKLRKQNPRLASSGVWRIVWVQHQEGGQVARFEMDEDAFKFLRSCLYKARLGSKFILVSPVEKSAKGATIDELFED